ncbi:MAG: histidine phosphatase family protein [Treponema sp.]|nr:histidine phosphatase family protein [Treponema sp.]
MNLYFIRHAQPDYEHDTITDMGHLQAAALAEYYEDVKVDELYHSSMGRAGVTASYLAEKWNLEAKPIDWARELKWGKGNGDAADNMSPWEVKDRIIQAEKAYPEGDSWKTLPELKGDSLVEDYDAHCKAIDAFLAEQGYVRQGQLYKAVEPNDKTVVIVCHGGVISALVSYLTNVPFFQYISHMGVDLTAVTKMRFHGGKDEVEPAQLVYINSQAHLGIK